MKTDDLIAMLASEAVPVESRVWQRRYGLALCAGVIGAALLLMITLNVRPDIAEVVMQPSFWAKLAFPGALAAGALVAAIRLSRPGGALGRVSSMLAAPVLVVWLLAAIQLARTEPGGRSVLIWGETWASCPLYVALLSVPAFIALLWVMKTLAPTRLALAGASAGLLAGAVGAAAYALYCPETGVAFLGIWYLAGMLIPTTLGAIIGPRLLRW